MRHDDTRDNTTDIEATIIEADNRDMTPVDMDNPREGVFDAIVTREASPIAKALFSQPHFGGASEKEERHEEHNDGANGYDDGDDIEEDDGQPSEYDEWQDYMGGDDWDHGQYDDCGW